MKHVFTSKTDAGVRVNDILVKSHKAANYSGQSLTALDPTKKMKPTPTNY